MKKKILIILLILIFIYCMGGVIYSIIISNKNNNDNNADVVVTIKNYDYKIDVSVISALYKREFENLKTNLEDKDISFDEYVKSIAKLYIIDLYSLKDKINKYNVTSSQYVNNINKENFELKVSETLYKYIEDNTDNLRKQELPRVSEVVIKGVENTTYMLGSNEYEAYNVNIEWLYEKDLGYDVDAILILIKDGDVISVVEERRLESSE